MRIAGPVSLPIGLPTGAGAACSAGSTVMSFRWATSDASTTAPSSRNDRGVRGVSRWTAGTILVAAVLAAGARAPAASVQLAALDEGASGGRAGDQELPWTSLVRDVQKGLRALGSYKGPIDGRPTSAPHNGSA